MLLFGDIVERYFNTDELDKKYPLSIPEKDEWTVDDIIDWFINRRGGTREQILAVYKEKSLRYFAENFKKYWIHFEYCTVKHTGIGIDKEDWEVLKDPNASWIDRDFVKAKYNILSSLY